MMYQGKLLDYPALRAEQRRLASQLSLADTLSELPTLVGGADVGFEQGGAITRGVIVLLEYPSLRLIEHQVARIATVMPYRTGLLAFREFPALQAAWQQLSRKPDLVVVDGQGIAHPNGLGLASHFGLLAEVPTIGVAKNRLCGHFSALPSLEGQACPLWDKDRQIGWVWRGKPRCNPLFISPGHRVSVPAALDWVQRLMAGYRLPEPTRLADAIASCRCPPEKLYQQTATRCERAEAG